MAVCAVPVRESLYSAVRMDPFGNRIGVGLRTRRAMVELWAMGWKLPALAAVLGVVALTLTGVGLGLVIGGPFGALAGAVPGALAGVAAGFVPSLRDWADRRHDAARTWETVAEPVMNAAQSGPAALLRPDRQVVQFTGREAELAELRGWCGSDHARLVRVIVGAGGVGKTRLALRVAADWEAGGNQWRLVTAEKEALAVAAARGVTSGPVLLVVDYAETRAGLEALLRAVLSDLGPIRVLLLARSLGEWWDRLIETSPPAVGRLLTAAEPVRLAETITTHASDAELVAAAIPYFSRALDVDVPEEAEFELPARRVPVLVLHAAALVAVLRFASNPALPLRVAVAAGVLDELLEHEARYWRRTATAARLTEDGAVLKPVVAAAALLGADNLTEAAELVARVPELADTSQAQRWLWARWLYGIYPAGPDERLGSLQPDLLAETHVVRQLAANARLARACLRNLRERQAEHALTVLARAWAHQDDAQRLIAEALHADLTHLAMPAAQVALQTRSDLGTLLAAALEHAPAPPDVLSKVAKALPYPSVVLAQADLAVTWRVRTSLPPDAEPAEMAEWSHRAGLLLSQLGRAADALEVTERAVAIRRALAAANPGRYRADLARSLSSLGVKLSELGHAADAVPVTEEAVAIRRELAAADPGRYRPGLAVSLNNLGVWLAEAGRPADALPVTEEAVAIRRDLAAANPDRYRSGLARSLTTLGVRLSELGRPADALPVTEEAVAIYRELAAANPDRNRAYLARALSSLGLRLSELHRPADAVPAEQEAVAIRRDLAAANPDRYRPDLAQSLGNVGLWLFESDRPADALPAAEESVAIYRELAAANPVRYDSELTAAQDNLAAILSSLRGTPS
jgi:tetratricopeptide (TPR) repeat protein